MGAGGEHKMKGIILKDSIKLFGFKEGFAFWARWNIGDPIKMWIWLNIIHKPYCVYSGFFCKDKDCKYTHLLTKKEIKQHWKKLGEEANTVEKGPDGKCVYCREEKGEFEIFNPNPDKINSWLVCGICKEVIELQQELIMYQLVRNTVKAQEISDKLLEISKKTGKEIYIAEFNKKFGFSSITYSKSQDLNTN